VLLTQWKATHPSGNMQFAAAVSSALKNAGNAIISVFRTGGSTGPASVNYATTDGTALAGTDYATRTGTLTWADGDTAAQTISVPLLNNPAIGATKTFSVTLSAPTFGTVAAPSTHTVSVLEPPPVSVTLDVDGDGHYFASTDGLMILRYLLLVTNTAISNNAVGTSANNTLPAQIIPLLDALKPHLDVDGDGNVSPGTDGQIVLRYLLGLRGSALTAGIAGVGPRPTLQIETYIQSLMP
jgi:Calx-beta domain